MFSLKEEKKGIKIILGIICLIFLLISLFSIVKYGNSTLRGSLSSPDNDDVKFIRSAWTLVESGQYIYHNPGSSTVFMMPGLTFTLAFFVELFGKYGGITAFRIFQALIQTGSLYIIFLTARKIFNSKIAIAAVIINVLYISNYWVANLILTETLFKFFVLLLVYFSIYAIEENKTKYYVFGSIAWGLATLFRPTIATYPIIILIMWILRKYSFKDMFKHTIVVGGIFCLILSPWWIRNYIVFHKFIPLTLASGNPMLQGTYINYDQTSRATDGLDYLQFKYPAENELATNAVEVQISMFRLKNLVPKQPLQFLYWYTIGKTNYQLRFPFIWTEFFGVKLWVDEMLHKAILLLGAIGIIKYFIQKDRNKSGTILFATIIFFIAAYLPFYTFERYFYPAIPFLTIFAAYSFVPLFSKVKLKLE